MKKGKGVMENGRPKWRMFGCREHDERGSYVVGLGSAGSGGNLLCLYATCIFLSRWTRGVGQSSDGGVSTSCHQFIGVCWGLEYCVKSFFLLPRVFPPACQVRLISRCFEVPYRGRQLACEFAPFARAGNRTPNHLFKGREYLLLTPTRQVTFPFLYNKCKISPFYNTITTLILLYMGCLLEIIINNCPTHIHIYTIGIKKFFFNTILLN